MSIFVYITVEDISTRISDGFSKIELESATSPGGSFSEITELTLVAGTYYYSYEDSAGSIDTYYKYRFSSADDLTKSDYSNVFQPEGVTRKRIRQFAINEYKAGEVLVAASGSASQVVFTDYRVTSSLYEANRGKGNWLLPTSGNEDGVIRRVANSDPTAGEYNTDSVWSTGPTTDDIIERHWLASPDEWNRAIDNGLARYSHVERIPFIGDGSGEQSLAGIPWLKTRRQVLGLWYTPVGGSLEQPWGSRGKWWGIRQDTNILYLKTSPALGTTDTIYIDAIRRMSPLLTDSSVAPLVCELEVIGALAYDEVLRVLLEPGADQGTQDKAVLAQRRVEHQRKLRALRHKFAPVVQYQLPQLQEPPVVPHPFRSR